MHIPFTEILNFRKLKSVRIDFDEKTTVCVGANSSGKTSAMLAMGHFLVDSKRFTTSDFTLSNWKTINEIGALWEDGKLVDDAECLKIDLWQSMVPAVDVWLSVAEGEIHYARNLIPSLDWSGEYLGVRIRFEPKNVFELAKEYLMVRSAAIKTKKMGRRCVLQVKNTASIFGRMT